MGVVFEVYRTDSDGQEDTLLLTGDPHEAQAKARQEGGNFTAWAIVGGQRQQVDITHALALANA